MPTVNIEGVGKVNFPDNMTPEQIASAIEKDILPSLKDAKTKGADPSEGRLPFRPFGLDTGLTMPQGVSRFAAGAGKAGYDLARGAGQMAGMVSPEEVAESRRLDQPLMETGAGVAGNLIGNIAAIAPTAVIPGANTLTGSATIGAGIAALSPTTADESRLANMGMGAGAGALGHGAGKLLGRMIRPVSPSIGAKQAELAKAAAREGIPLRASQVTGSKPLALTESVMENLPFTFGKQVARKEAQKAAFNAAVLRRAGITADKAGPEVLLAQKNALGDVFEDISGRNVIDFNKGVTDKLATVGKEASRRLAKPEPITNTIDDILADVNQSGFLDGKKYQGWRETLGRMARGDDSEAHYAGQVKRVLDEAFNTQISGTDAAAWKQASKQYGNLKNILQAMGGAGTEPISGNIAPSQLASALTRQVGKEGKALGRGDLNELSKIGRAFISENLPDSGTAQRTFYQNLLTGNLAGAVPGASAGAGIGYYRDGPQGAAEGAAYGAVLGAGTALAGPKLAQTLMNSKLGQAYLTKGILPITQAERDALAHILRTGATGMALQGQSNR